MSCTLIIERENINKKLYTHTVKQFSLRDSIVTRLLSKKADVVIQQASLVCVIPRSIEEAFYVREWMSDLEEDVTQIDNKLDSLGLVNS